MTFGQAVSSVFSNYATFAGRAPRSEYWWFFLFNMIVSAICAGLDSALFGSAPGTEVNVVQGIWSLAVLLPSLAVSVRRLHDIGRSGWWFLIVLIPVIGMLILLFWHVQPSEPEANRFGAPPLNGGA